MPVIAQSGVVIYGDVYFVINFCMDFLALYAACRVNRARYRLARLLAAAALGSAYALAMLFWYGVPAVDIAIHIAVSLLMCAVCGGYAGFGGYVRQYLLFIAASVILGGGIQAVYYLGEQVQANFFGRPIQQQAPRVSFWYIIAAALLITCLFLAAGRIFKARNGIRTVELTVEYCGREHGVTALADSGNLLRDPANALPVIIIGRGAVTEILGPVKCALLASPAGRLELGSVGEIAVRGVAGERTLPLLYEARLYTRQGGKKKTLNAELAADLRRERFDMYDAIFPMELMQ